MKQLPGFTPPEYVASNNYVRTGNAVILYADDEYFKKIPGNSSDISVHHNFNAYLYCWRRSIRLNRRIESRIPYLLSAEEWMCFVRIREKESGEINLLNGYNDRRGVSLLDVVRTGCN
jgi:hypothetical protein